MKMTMKFTPSKEESLKKLYDNDENNLDLLNSS
jgi:hypothetical protein